ncbi:MAG TPA: hypothetical protein VFV52_02895 [Bacilli bacterium]|nr:hypothetical protein [Bacilli bacterium]
MERCPKCNCRDIGKIGSSQYYCWGCFVEFSLTADQQLKMFDVEEDGSLVPYHLYPQMADDLQVGM